MKTLLVYVLLCAFSFTAGFFFNPFWLWIPVLLGLNLIQSAFTGFCPIRKLAGGGTRRSKKQTAA
jgi:hypothetical protein